MMDIQKIMSKLKNVKPQGARYTALCPSHDDKQNSLSISESNGKILLYCHARCSIETICDKLGIKKSDLFTDERPPQQAQLKKTIEAVYPYVDEQGKLLYEAVRYNPKSFTQRRPNGKGGYVYDLKNTRRVLYKLPDVLQAKAKKEIIYVVEGEKDVQNLVEWAGVCATTSPGGASKWRMEYTETIAGAAEVVIFPDNDTAGQAHADAIAQALLGKVDSLKIIQLPDLPLKSDVTDYINAGHTPQELQHLITSAAEYELPQLEKPTKALIDKKLLLSDTGNADRLLILYGENIRFSHELQKWYVWSGHHWQQDDNGEVVRLAIETFRLFKVQVTEEFLWLQKITKPTEAEQNDLKYFEALKSFATKSTNSGRIKAALELAATMNSISQKDLDTHHHLLTVKNGTLDLRTGQLQAHRKDYYITKMIDFDYNPKAECTTFKAFLNKIFEDNGELIDFIQSFFGYCITGETKEQLFCIGYGSGANGKSTLLETVSYILSDHSQTVPSAVLMEQDKKGGDASPELARLKGKRLCICSESKDNQRLNEAIIKALTGSETISCRPLYSQGFEYQPTYKIWLNTNHKPIIRNSDNGIWRRVKLIPFNVTIQEHEQDKNLMEKLKKEADGILNWLVDGAVKYYTEGLIIPEIVKATTAEYRVESDNIQQFIDDVIIQEANHFMRNSVLYEAYIKWCNEQGITPITTNVLGRKMAEKGFKSQRKPNTRGYLNITLKEQYGNI